ncbi:MAG: hypothetical protein GF311_18280 [Candidatus Lokiarchaeota archaeon]|nr:hypothetical protein [Candidatus Lokiarchaeota archaeon]
MKVKESEGCACDKPDIKEKFDGGHCSLNQIIKCHGDQPIDELFKHIELEKDNE